LPRSICDSIDLDTPDRASTSLKVSFWRCRISRSRCPIGGGRWPRWAPFRAVSAGSGRSGWIRQSYGSARFGGASAARRGRLADGRVMILRGLTVRL